MNIYTQKVINIVLCKKIQMSSFDTTTINTRRGTMKKYNFLLIILFSLMLIFSFYIISNFRAEFNDAQIQYYYKQIPKLNIETFFEKERQMIVTVDSKKTEKTIGYIDFNYTGCIPEALNAESCVDLNEFRNNNHSLLVGKNIYNLLTPLEKDQQLVYLDSLEPYRIYTVIGVPNERTDFDDMFIKKSADTTNGDELVNGYIKDTSIASEVHDLEKVERIGYFREMKTVNIMLELLPIMVCVFLLSLIVMIRKEQLKNTRIKVKYIVGASRLQIKMEGMFESVLLAVLSVMLAIICHQILLYKFSLTLLKPSHIIWVYCISFIITVFIFIIVTIVANRKIKFTDIERIGG